MRGWSMLTMSVSRRKHSAYIIAGMFIFSVLIIFSRFYNEPPPGFRTGNPQEDGIFVYEAFQVSDTEVRFVYFTDKDNSDRPQFRDNVDSEWKDVESIPTPEIPYGCHMHTFMGVARFSKKFMHPFIWLSSHRTETFYSIKVHDRRPSPASHQLGVLILPMYLLADWPIVVQFVEFWKFKGATKFFVYKHSVSEQVDKVLSYYQRQLGKDFEIIPWSDLPVSSMDGADYQTDPNTQLFHVGHQGAIFDIVLRSRTIVKFLAMTDLDEILHMTRPLPETLHLWSIIHPHAGSFALHWQYADHMGPSRIPSSISDVHFDHLRGLRFPPNNTLANGYSNRVKSIIRPDRVLIPTFHHVAVHEKIPQTDENYTRIDVTEKGALVVHMRPIYQLSKHERKSEFKELLLTGEADALEKVVNRTHPDAKVSLSPWYTTHLLTLRHLEVCRKRQASPRDEYREHKCSSLGHCREILATAHLFPQVQQTWTNIADRTVVKVYAG